MLTFEQLRELAVAAGAIPASEGEYWPHELIICEQEFEAFAKAIYAAGQAAEREACAEICDRYAMAMDYSGTEYVRSRECQQAAAAIRARSEKGSSE